MTAAPDPSLGTSGTLAGEAAGRLLARAAAPGRIRGIGLAIWERVRTDPSHAGSTLRQGLREARALHSSERRLVADLLYDLIRHGPVLERALGTADPEALWTGALVLRGLPPSEAPGELPWERVRDLATARAHATVGLGDDEALAVLGALPLEVARELRRAFGDDALRFVDASNDRAPVTLRARDDRDALIARLRAEGITAIPSPLAARAVRVEGRPQLAASPSFRDGLFEVQDEGSQLLAELVEPVGTVVDLCAGAGGKTLAMARPGVQLVATDVRPQALDELRKRAKRAGVRVRVEPPVRGQLPPSVAKLQADRVLVDAPCSGTGTWRRHPELRWRLTSDRLEEVGRLQRELLDRGAALVKPGGRLVYGTCSVLPREDEDVVAGFLARHPSFTLARTLRLAPHTDDTDGFYGAVLVRATT